MTGSEAGWKQGKMAGTDGIAANLLEIRKTGKIEEQEVKEAFTNALVELSRQKGNCTDKDYLNNVRGVLLLLLHDGGSLCSTLASVQDEFYKMLLSNFFRSAEEGDGKRKSSIPITLQSKLLVKILLKECSPFIKGHFMLLADQIQVNLINKNNTLVLLSVLLHTIGGKVEFSGACTFILKLLQNSNVSGKIHSLCMSLICSVENHALLAQETENNLEAFEAGTRKLCNWLIYTSSPQSTDKATPTRKKVTVQEIDGTPSRDFFTVLNFTSVLITEHLHNIHAFSMLQNWLLVLQSYNAEIWNNELKKIKRPQRPSSAIPRLVGQSSFYIASSASSESSGPVSLSSSLSSLNSFLYVEEDDEKAKDLDDLNQSLYENRSLRSSSSLRRPQSVTPKRSDTFDKSSSFDNRNTSVTSIASISSGGITLKNASVRYCLRLLSQADRVPQRAEDKALLLTVVIEAVKILTLLCRQDDSLVQKVFPEIKRVHSRILGNSSEARRFYPADIQFFVEHYDSMIYNTEELVQSYLRTVPSQLYTSSSACFEMLDFCLRNFTFFERFSFLSRFFPNLFKLIAWNPRSFVSEFIDLLPLFVTDFTVGEVFHSLLEIPCTSAMLELSQKEILDNFLEANLQASFGEDSFLSKSHRNISEFFLRSESGGPETIDKLEKIYFALRQLSKRTRVQVCCQIVPILLTKFFQCIRAQMNQAALKRLFPSMLERIFILFPDPLLETAVRHVLSEQFIYFCMQCPDLISTQQDEILYVFKKLQSSLIGLDSVVTSLVYCIGEFSTRPGVCTMEQVARYYERINTLIYEAKCSLFQDDDFPISARFLSSLISTAGKLAAFSQDFVPKTVLGLTKLVNTEWNVGSHRISQREFEVLVSRATDVVNVLRLPNVSPAILCSGANVEPWHLDADNSRQLKVQTISRRETKIT